jgi:hypothetical protein
MTRAFFLYFILAGNGLKDLCAVRQTAELSDVSGPSVVADASFLVLDNDRNTTLPS